MENCLLYYLSTDHLVSFLPRGILCSAALVNSFVIIIAQCIHAARPGLFLASSLPVVLLKAGGDLLFHTLFARLYCFSGN